MILQGVPSSRCKNTPLLLILQGVPRVPMRTHLAFSHLARLLVANGYASPQTTSHCTVIVICELMLFCSHTYNSDRLCTMYRLYFGPLYISRYYLSVYTAQKHYQRTRLGMCSTLHVFHLNSIRDSRFIINNNNRASGDGSPRIRRAWLVLQA